METLREMITKRQNEILDGDLHPTRASEILTEISALYGNVLDEVKKRQIIYNKVLFDIYDEEKKANRAKLKAETTDEYENYLQAKNTEKLTLEMIRALKYFLRSKEEKMSFEKRQDSLSTTQLLTRFL